MSAGTAPEVAQNGRGVARRVAAAAMAGAGLLTILAPPVLAAPVLATPLAGIRALDAADPADSGPLPPAYIVVDADTGAVIAAHEEHRAVPPASTVKLMTALVALEHLPLDATLTISARVEAQPASKITMRAGEVWPLTDALHALLMASANDAAYALAENAAGGLAGFADAMTVSGDRMGLMDSTFNDPAGLDAEGEGFRGGSLASAYDLAIIARNALSVPAIATPAARLEDFAFTGPNGAQRTIPNHNDAWLSVYPGATGLKAGFTERANRTFVASATRDGRTCIAVVLGIEDTLGWASRLSDQCFATPVADQAGMDTLPPVRVTTVETRQQAVAGFPRTLGASAATVAGIVVTRDNPTPAAAVATPAADPQESAAPSPAGASTSASSPGLISARRAALVTMAALGAAFFLRRRQVSRQRQRRLARQKMLHDAHRRGVLTLLEPDDGPTAEPRVALVGRSSGGRTPGGRPSSRRAQAQSR